MGLIQDDRVVAAEHPVALDLGEQDSVGHQLDQRSVAGLVGEADLVADGLAQRGAELGRDALGDRSGGQPAGLRVPDLPADPAAEFEAELGQLGRLPRAGLAGDDDDLVVADRLGERVALLADRQLGRVVDGRHGGRAGRDAGRGGLDLPLDRGEDAGGLGVVPLFVRGVRFAQPVEPTREPPLVLQRHLAQAASELTGVRCREGCHRQKEERRRTSGIHATAAPSADGLARLAMPAGRCRRDRRSRLTPRGSAPASRS